MPKTRINCPNCRQPIMADVEQLFDLAKDPSAKTKLLSGAYNLVQCPNCGYKGNLSTPLVYHDPDKELLLTFFPGEMGMQRNDQERLLGTLINQVVNNLPQEKRKGYLLRPQSVLTMQGLIERILEGDGITREMVQAQQKRMSLLQRLADAEPDARAEIARQEDSQIDGDFFNLLRRLIETSLVNGDQDGARQLSELQQSLLPITTFGQEVQAQSKEVEAAVESLRQAGRNLTREKLLDLIIEAPNETRLAALVGMARPGMDYAFFQLLSERIERTQGEERAKLDELRGHLLEMTREVDAQMEARVAQIRGLIEQIAQAANIQEAMAQNIGVVDELFVQELNNAMEAARKKSDLERLGKLQKMVEVIQQASAPPPGLDFIEELMAAPDDQARQKLLEENKEQVTSEFLDMLTSLLAQVEGSEEKEMAARLKDIHRQVLRFSMQANLRA
jgi:hypothetical protein